MDDITAARLEPLSDNTGHEEYPPKKGSPQKQAIPEKRPPTPSIETDEGTDEYHEIDELA